MKTVLVVFEDDQVHHLFPLTLNRPAFDLLCGIRLLREKAAAAYPGAEMNYFVREYLLPLVRERHPQARVNGEFGEQVLFVNGRVLWDAALARQIPSEGDDRLFFCRETLVAARLSGPNVPLFHPTRAPFLTGGAALPQTLVSARTVTYFWDLVNENPRQIEADYEAMGWGARKEGRLYEGVHLIDADAIAIAEGAVIKPGVVLDAEDGPVVIDQDVTIQSLSVLQGPCYIGKNSVVKISSKVYEGTSVGEVCKIGGEVTESVILGYSNKQHDGFLGHAYLGQWVNLGADTNNSDLKNDYGTVTCFINGDLVDTGSQFVGMAMGDYSRTGINTMFNTGTVVGIGCNIFGIGFPPKSIPSFTWGGAEAMVEYRFDKCLETIQRVMERRHRHLSPEEENLVRRLYTMTEDEREKARIMNRMRTS